ncbi:MAG: pentapeptide repeat-containing protein, partial [Phormidesmis sp.]
MKAKEVLRRYAAGERNFCNANLRGANFSGQDLSGADLSGADIRSANFANATLRGVNFAKAQGGLQRQWRVAQLLLIAVLSTIAGVLQGFTGALLAYFFDSTNFSSPVEQAIGGGIYVLLVLVACGAITRQGFTIRAFGSILSAFAVAGAFAVAFAVAGTFAFAVAFAGTFALAVAFASALAGAVSFVGTFAVAVAGAFALAGAVAGALAVSFMVAFAFAVAGSLLSAYVGWQVLRGNEKFAIVRMFGLALAALGGTSFCGADLTGAIFSQALLKGTNFADSRQRATTLTHVCWQGANKLNRARLGSAILQDRRVRTLLTTPEKGYKQDLTDANLRGANLNGVTLEAAILKRAVLSGALLQNAVLKDAILTEVQAVGADFTSACFTGATLEAWNIDSTTALQNMDCEYVFLREHPDEKGSRERRPHNPDKVFQPGDFEKFFKEMLDEVQILIRNGIEPAAFRAAMQSIMERNPEVTQDSIKRIEKQGTDVLLALQVPEGTDKAKVERDWDSGYQAGLTAGREAERLESAPKFEKIAFLLADKEINIQNRNELMTGND